MKSLKKYVYNDQINSIEDKIPHIINLATNNTPNARMNKIKNKISSNNNLPTTAALTAVENIMPCVCNLVDKAYCDLRISEKQNTNFAAPDDDNFTSKTLDEKIIQEN